MSRHDDRYIDRRIHDAQLDSLRRQLFVCQAVLLVSAVAALLGVCGAIWMVGK